MTHACLSKALGLTLMMTALMLFPPASLWAESFSYRTDRIEYRFPDQANVVNVRAFGAKGDGVTDDTDAIAQAVRHALGDHRFRNPGFVYLPAGTYVIRDSIRARVTDAPDGQGGWSDGWRCGLILVGESRERTILRLADEAPGFGDKDKPKPMIVTGSTGHGKGHDSRIGGWGNEAFRNTLMNFTVDTGKGNAGAIGIDYLASNRGTIEEVTIRGGGLVGLDMTRPWPGPGLIKNVWIDGFDFGIRQRHMDCSMTFEHVLLSDQKVAGVDIDNAFMTLRGIESHNAVPVFQIKGRGAIVTILDSRFVYAGTDTAPPAIASDGRLTLKGVDVEGYPVGVASLSGTEPLSPAVDLRPQSGQGNIALFSSREPVRLHDGPIEVPDLPVKETPIFHHSQFDKWASPRDFAAGSRTAGIQEAIDSGAEIVYLPNGEYVVAETIVIRGKVRKIMGMEARLNRARGVDRVDPLFRFDEGDGDFVVIEHLSGSSNAKVVEHNSGRTLAIRKSDLTYRNTPRGTGDIFLEDGMFARPKVLYPQNLWARQLNSEFGSTPQFENHGGRAWILGMKVEGWPRAVFNVGGITECYGLYAMVPSGDASQIKDAFVENQEGWLATVFRVGGQGDYRVKFKDTWDGESREKGGSREYPLTLAGRAFDPPQSEPATPGGFSVKAVSSSRADLRWTGVTPESIALRGYRIERNGTHIATVPVGQHEFTDTGLDELAAYDYRIMTECLRGGVSQHAAASITTPADTTPPTVTKVSVDPRHPTLILLDFDKPLTPVSAVDPANYTLEPSVEIGRARLTPEGTRVILEARTPLADGQAYTLTLNRITDRSRAAMTVAEPAQTFTAWHDGEGLLAEFWNGDSFAAEPTHTRIDTRVDYWWGDGSPGEGVEGQKFVARWSGVLRPKVSGEYRFNTGVRRGGRVLLDGKVVHNEWTTRNEWTHSPPIHLEAGKRYTIAFEIYADGHAGARLKWEGPIKNQFIDAEHLFLPKP